VFEEEDRGGYDRARYYGGRERGRKMEEVLESPASPEVVEEEPRGQVRRIPVEELPQEVVERGGWVEVSGPAVQEEEQEEDLDEDILYLRLIALRSLANEREEEERREKAREEEQGREEMLELLQEAEAAGRVEAATAQAAAAEVITIEDDDPISELKLSLHESYIATGFQQSIEVVEVLDSPSYSPTQSPQPLSPIYLPPDCQPSPPASPSDCQVVEPAPPLPPSPPPCPPPPPSAFPEPVPCLAVVAPVQAAHSPEPPQEPLDMDLDSGDEAESQFFRTQRLEKEESLSRRRGEVRRRREEEPMARRRDEDHAFPASVWDFGGGRRDDRTPPARKRREEGRREEESKQSKRRKRKSSSRDKENLKKEVKGVSVPAPEEGEDEESLRAILLAQVSQAHTKRPVQELVKVAKGAEAEEKPSVPKPTTTPLLSTPPSASTPPPSSKPPPNATPPPSTPPSSPSPPPPPPTVPKPSSPRPVAIVKPTPPPAPSLKPSQPSPSPSIPPAKPPVPSVRPPAPKVKPTLPHKPKPQLVRRASSSSKLENRISKADKAKHFPNLSKKVVITRMDSDSDDDDVEEKPKGPAVIPEIFGLNLEAFLKEARNTAPPPTKTAAAKVKTLTMTPKLKAQALKLTLADKKRLISSKISHLSRSKQIEYQRLKEILAKKEALKKKGGTTDPRPAAVAKVAAISDSIKATDTALPAKTAETAATGKIEDTATPADAALDIETDETTTVETSKPEDSKNAEPATVAAETNIVPGNPIDECSAHDEVMSQVSVSMYPRVLIRIFCPLKCLTTISASR